MGLNFGSEKEEEKIQPKKSHQEEVQQIFAGEEAKRKQWDEAHSKLAHKID
jgi:hypothetical protein